MRRTKPMPVNPDYPPSEVRRVDPAELSDEEVLRLIRMANTPTARHADDNHVRVPREI